MKQEIKNDELSGTQTKPETKLPIKALGNNVLIKGTCEPVTTFSLINKDSEFIPKALEFKVLSIGSNVNTTTIAIKVGDNVLLDPMAMSTLERSHVSRQYFPDSINSVIEHVRSLRSSDYNNYLQNNPKTTPYIYLLINAINITGVEC